MTTNMLCKALIYTENAYSAKREMSESACIRSVAGCCQVMESIMKDYMLLFLLQQPDQ